MNNNRIVILLIIINTIAILSTRNDLYGQSCCDTKAGPFVICEEPPLPNISFSQLEEIINNSVDIKNEHINNGDIIRIFFIINCKGEDFNYRTLQPADSTLKDKLFKTIHSNMKWTAGKQAGRKIDFQQQILLSIVNGKFVILNDNDKKGKKNKK
jgi:hypothetical protein